MPQKSQIFCSIRKNWVAATPEEYVRQSTIQHLIELGFPSSYICVEKELRSMPHLSLNLEAIPERRLDILCYGKIQKDEITPLFLIECKSISISSREIGQVTGYNHLLKVPFIGLSNQHEYKCGWYDWQTKEYKFVNYFPKYQELIDSICY